MNEKMLNELVAKLLTNGFAEFSQDGLNIKASCEDGAFKISASFASPEEDTTDALIADFENYIQSLDDDFFMKTAESFPNGKLKELSDKLESKNPKAVKEAISEFMNHLKIVASRTIEEIDSDIMAAREDIEAIKKDIKALNDVRATYMHVLRKEF